MQFSAATIIIAFAGFAFAAPAYNVCPGGLLYSSPVCCDTDVLGVAALNCKTGELLCSIVDFMVG